MMTSESGNANSYDESKRSEAIILLVRSWIGLVKSTAEHEGVLA